MEIDMDLLLKEIINIRRELHMNPEKGLEEYKTSEFISDYLKMLGIQVIKEKSGTAVLGVIKGGIGKQSVAIRADMDCLSVDEQTGVDFCSRNKGLMHACGHDGHMAALLGLARYICLSERDFKNNVLLIFQPAEEGPGGAEAVINSGMLDGFNIKAVLGMHIFPEINEGKIGCCSGPITARNGEIDIEIVGKSAHGALPHKGIDSVIIASELMMQIQSVISRRIDPRENGLVTFGKISGGEARNIIAGSVRLEGTIRAFSKEIYDLIKLNIYNICRGLETGYGCRIKTEIRDMYPEVYNDAGLFEMFINGAGKENVETVKPLMIAEDFSYYRRIAPELMFLLGSKNEDRGFTYPLHSSRFNFDETILMKAISIYFKMISLLE